MSQRQETVRRPFTKLSALPSVPHRVSPEFVLGGGVDYVPRDLQVGTAEVEHLAGPDQLRPPDVQPESLR
jgi:hypothetical protein